MPPSTLPTKPGGGSVDPGFQTVAVSGPSTANVSWLVNNFTGPVLASALLDREATLRRCARAAAVLRTHTEMDAAQTEQLATLRRLLAPFAAGNHWDDSLVTATPFHAHHSGPLDNRACVELRKRLHRIPRRVNNPHVAKRASVLIPLCNVRGEASVLFTIRSLKVTRHQGEVRSRSCCGYARYPW